jgi:hypothetical protein
MQMSWVENSRPIIRRMSSRADERVQRKQVPAEGISGAGVSTKEELGRRSGERCSDAMICERCGKAEMYRMHAVWRCPECGYKTDCCGW